MKEHDLVRKKWLYDHRNKQLTFEDIREMSLSYYGDSDRLRLYGMRPHELIKNDIRISGRTAIECCIDSYAEELVSIANKQILQITDQQPMILDLFCGSGNLLYHLANSLNSVEAIGFENDLQVYQFTKHNFNKIQFSAELFFGDYASLLNTMTFNKTAPIVIVIAQPWADGFSHEHGLDLLKTSPSTHTIIENLIACFPHRQLIILIQIYERLVEASLQSLSAYFSSMRCELTRSAREGSNIGFLIGGIHANL